jgi:arylsulfatase A
MSKRRIPKHTVVKQIYKDKELKKILCIVCCLIALQLSTIAEEKLPNFVIIFLDDAGWGDYNTFQSTKYPTPHVDNLAKEGTKFTQFYVPQAICSASRSALLSGCYPGRTGVVGAHGPNGRGLEPKFATIAEVLKKKNYATAHFGKWHCGDQPETRPLARGFDKHAGLMYSNDMWRFHPTAPEKWGKHPLQFWDNGKVTIDDIDKPDQKNLTKWATENAVNFIEENKEKPFFLYVAHSMPHVPLFCSDEFEGKSGVGLYGDVCMEIDWSVGKINQALKDNGLEENTMVIFSSDNGPWSGYGNHAGATPFRNAKASSFDGGIRSPLIIKFPGRVPTNKESKKVFCSIDIQPTLAVLAGTEPSNEIDGKNILPLITGAKDAKSPHKYYAFSTGRNFEGILSPDGRWKLHLPHKYRVATNPANDGAGGKYTTKTIELSLFDMKNDPYEKTNVIDKYPEIASELQKFTKLHKAKFWTKK